VHTHRVCGGGQAALMFPDVYDALSIKELPQRDDPLAGLNAVARRTRQPPDGCSPPPPRFWQR